MSAKFPKEFLLTDEEKTKYQYKYLSENLSIGPNHNFAVIDAKLSFPKLLSSAGCTGGLPRLHSCWVDSKGKSINPNIAFISRPYKTENQAEYLNTLLSPITSPYRWWMTPDKYKVTLTENGDISMWFCLDGSLNIAEVHGLAILERIFNQHSNNPFWDIWKKSGLPFEAFFYLTHSWYGSFTMTRFSNSQPSIPYSSFNMFETENYTANKYTGTKSNPGLCAFSAPRFFQMKPNLEYAKHVTCENWNVKPEERVFATVGAPNRGRARANSIWDSENTESDYKLTKAFEEELREIFKKTHIKYMDAYHTKVQPRGSWNLPGETDWIWLKDSEKVKTANMYRINLIIDLLKVYTPQFLSEKVA